MTICAALVAILGIFPLVEFTSAAPAAAAGLLSCDGSTIYSIERGASTVVTTAVERGRTPLSTTALVRGSAATSNGTLNALTTSTVGGSSVTTTAISSIPAGGAANALGITTGGTAAYLVDQTTTAANTAVIHRYDAVSGTWTTYTGSSGANSSFVAGAVDPVNGIYYYASYAPGTASTPATATIYGFNTVTNTAISGVIGTVALGTGNSTLGQNGDLAFDGGGNLYLLSSDTVNVAINIVHAPIPTTGTGVTLTSTLLSKFASTAAYNGIAFDNAGNLYVQDVTSSGVAQITKLNPNNGATLAGPTPLSSNAQAFVNDDLGACSVNPTLVLQKNVASRFASGDQFGLSITGGGLTTGNTATTSGSATGLQGAKVGPVIAQSGTAYTLAETGASGASLADYQTTYACTDTANGNATVASGTGQSFTLPLPATVTTSPAVVCTFTNTALAATLTVVKSASPTTFTKAGQTISYRFAVTNTGALTLSGIGVTDTDLPGLSAISCPQPSLAPGTGETCTATYVTTQANVDAGKVTNTATAHGLPPGQTTPVVSPPSTATVTATQAPLVMVVKSASPASYSAAGQTISYTFAVTNTGNVTLSAVGVTDTDLPGLSAISCPQPSLAPAASENCTATYVTTQANVDAGKVTNTATAHGLPPGSSTPVVSAPSIATVPAVQAPGLSVVKTATPSSFSGPGQAISYRFRVTNTGNVTLTSVGVTDTDLPGLSVVSCPDPSLAPGQGESCTASYATTQGNVDAGAVTNTATANGLPPGSVTPVVSPPSTTTVPAVVSPSISVEKSASQLSFTAAGQTISYTFAVTNTGNQTLTGIGVTDTDLPGLSAISCPQPSLAPGAGETCTATYVTTQANVDAGAVTNTATAHGLPPGSSTPVVSPPSTATVPAVQGPAIHVAKSATPSSFSAAGQTISYTFAVTNTGNETLTSIGVTDTDLPGLSAISCPLSSLAPGAGENCTATYVTTQANVDAGAVTNTATAHGLPPASGTPVVSPPSTASVPAVVAPSIAVVKSATPASFNGPGQTISYTFAVTNTGDVSLTGVGVTDTDLPGLSAISCPQPSLAPGASENCTATYLTSQTDVNAGGVTNTATAHGLPPGSSTPVVSPPSTATVPAVQTPAITVVKSASPATFTAAGQTISYRFAVTNTGNVRLTGVGVTDTDLPGLSAISCPDPVLATGAGEECTASYVITQADVDAGAVTNTATAHGLPPNSVTPVVSAPSTATVPAVQAPLVMVVKSGTPSSFTGPGQAIGYTFAVTNTGNVTLTGVGVTDTDLPGLSLISCPQPSLAPGAGENCTATYVTTQADVDAGKVTNTATAHGLPPGSVTPIVSPPSTATVPAVVSPSISVVKSAAPPSFTGPGQTISYTFAVTNTGNVTLTGVGVTDSDLAGLSAISCPQPSLAPGAGENCSATYVTTQADVDAGAVTNTASAHGLPPGSTTPTVSPPSTATVPAVVSPSISVVKSASPSSFTGPGQTISYTFAVTNTGNVTLTGVGVTDIDLPGLSLISCPQPSLAPGAGENCTAAYMTAQADVDAGAVTNTAIAHGLPPGSATPVVSAPSTATVPAVVSPSISVVKSASPSNFTGPGQTVSWRFAVTNTGNVTLTSIGVTDTSLPGLSAVNCPQPSLAPGGGEECTATYVTTQADVDAGALTNTATANGLPPGSGTPVVSPPSTATLPAVMSPSISVVKSASQLSFTAAGQTISYTFAVTNTGNVTLTGVAVTDTDLPGLSAVSCPDPVLAPGGGEECTATYVTTQADMDAGAVTNTATASGLPPGSTTPVVSPPSTATVPAVLGPAIHVVKSASPSSFTGPGQTISYTFTVTNTGNETLTSVGVTDTGLPGLSAISCPQPSLAPAASESCTATYVTTQADVDAGAVTNTATANGLPPASVTPVVSPPATVTVPAVVSPGLSVVKSASPSSFTGPGQSIGYTFAVTNTGDVSLTGIAVTDTDLPGLSAISCPQPSLAPGAGEDCTATYLTSQADVDAGAVTNTATANGLPPGSSTPVVSPPSTATVPAVVSPGLSVVKSASPSSFSGPGQSISYRFTVTNTGNVTLSGVMIIDNGLRGLLSAISCPQPSLAPGAGEECIATYFTTQADVDAGAVTNTATANGLPPGSSTPVVSPPATVTVPAVVSPGLSVVKSASPSSFTGPGQSIGYTFAVTNTGNVTLTSVGVTDTDLPGLSAISCPDPVLAPRADEDCTATYVTTQADVDAGAVTNTATANGLPPRSSTPVDSPPATATVPAVVSASISMVKSALPLSYTAAGQTISYTFAVNNTGNVTLTSVGVTDTGLPGLSAISCPQPSLAPGAGENCTATYVTIQADVDAGAVTNTATAHGLPPGSTTPVESAPSTASVPAVQGPAIHVVKSASPSIFSAAGQTISYTFAVTNIGDVTLTSVGVTDTDLPGLSAISCPQPSLAPGASENCTATYIITQADVDAGAVTNTATAHGLPPASGTPVVSAPSMATVPAVVSLSISLVKSASPSIFTGPGQTISYTFAVTNTADVTLTGIAVTDTDLPGLSAISCPQPSLAPGDSEDCTATYLTSQADVDAGKVTNTATANGLPPGSTTPVVSPPSTVTVRAGVGAEPAISMVKSASLPSFGGPGQTIGYTFAVTNTGADTLTSVGVTDTDLPGLSAITCPQASLAAGAAEECTATYVTTQADVDAGAVTNTATAHGLPPGSTTPVVSAPSTATVPTVNGPAIRVVKSGTPLSFSKAGQKISYTFAVANTGTDTLSGIGVTDTDLPGLSAISCPRSSLAPGAGETCTATYLTTQADVDGGTVTNTATAHGLPPGSVTPVVSPPSTVTVRALPPIVQTPVPVTG